MKISVCVPVKNEAADLPRLIASLAFADEIIVIDTGSTDETVEICEKLGAKVVKHKFENFSQIRNFGTSLCRHDFVLNIDADCEVPPKLALEIGQLPETPSAYKIGRINFIWGKAILHADWGPSDDLHIWLYHKDAGSWRGEVHEEFVSHLPVKKLKNNLLHHNYTSVAEYLAKLNFYSDILVKKKREQGVVFSYWHLFYDPAFDFFKRYFYKLGFLEGLHGFFLCFTQSLFHVSVNIKLK